LIVAQRNSARPPRVPPLPDVHKNEIITMRKALPILLLAAGLAIVGYGLLQKDEQQATIDLGSTEIQLGEKDSAFSPFFIAGGILAAVGVVLMVRSGRT
jgi:hypothetical protein